MVRQALNEIAILARNLLVQKMKIFAIKESASHLNKHKS